MRSLGFLPHVHCFPLLAGTHIKLLSVCRTNKFLSSGRSVGVIGLSGDNPLFPDIKKQFSLHTVTLTHVVMTGIVKDLYRWHHINRHRRLELLILFLTIYKEKKTKISYEI